VTLIVVKYGGSVLDGGPAIKQAANTIKQELAKGTNVVVVASAIKGVTDQLLSAASTISDNTPLDVIDHIIGLGEEQSVRLLTSALHSIGVDAIEVTPNSPSWPIISDEKFGDAEPILSECKNQIDVGLKPLLKRGKTPVVCGFIGRSTKGRITTLGRGGSDTTAVILASCLDAEELVLVKDVGGIFSADPKIVLNAVTLPELSVWEAELLAATGSKILHEKVFKYKKDNLPIRIVSREQTLSGEGTMIKGTIPEFDIKRYEKPVYVITILGNLLSNDSDLSRISSMIKIGGSEFLYVQSDQKSTFLIISEPAQKIVQEIHNLTLSDTIKALSISKSSAMFEIQHRIIDPGLILKNIIEKLEVSNIKISFKMITHQSTIIIVDWDKKELVQKIIENLKNCS